MAENLMTVEQAARFGYSFPGVRRWNTAATRALCAMDAALITTPNGGIPAEFTAYMDPVVIEVLTAPRNARNIFTEEKKGGFENDFMKFPLLEMVGGTEEYSDYSNAGTSDINTNWISRKQYRFQTAISYGDLEVAQTSLAKLNLASAKQKAAANRIDIDSNAFYLLGVKGQQVYGIFNDPNLPASIMAGATGAGGATTWNTKSTKAIYDDILALFAQLAKQGNGLIDENTPLKLCLPPALNTYLGSATDFNVTVKKMVNDYFGKVDIVVVPELQAADGDATVFLIAPEVNGQKAATLAYGEKMRAGRVVVEMSSFRQKFASTTYGGIVYLPFAFASMSGCA